MWCMGTSTLVSASAEPAAVRQYGQWRLAAERFIGHRMAFAGIALLAAIALLCAAAPLLSSYDPEKTNLLLIYEAPSAAHLFGTDGLGRDLATRILYGGRVSLTIGVLAALVAISAGTLIGVAAGYYGGLVDGVLMRFVDMMYSFPRLFLLILFGVLFKGMSLGVQRPTPSWGYMLKDAQDELNKAPWTAVFPGLAIFLAVVSINFVGDGLRDALDPRHRGHR